ncbi:MAG: DNA repair protein RadC [Syntrophomonadaceae bacterium]|nr:DNA repair protein RadC [Syntrophomonadaceae bacterium]
MPTDMRPREKLAKLGAEGLNDHELLAIILGNGTRDTSALELANQLLGTYSSLRHLQEKSIEELQQIKGIGQAKAVTIKAALEIGRRIAIDGETRFLIRSPEDVQEYADAVLVPEMRDYDREHFMVLYLDRKGGVITQESVSVGGLHSSIVHPREVFKTAVKRSAASIILAHNHPSGDPAPSRQDIEITRRLIEAGRIMGIEIIDHVIIGENIYCSFKEKGLI